MKSFVISNYKSRQVRECLLLGKKYISKEHEQLRNNVMKMLRKKIMVHMMTGESDKPHLSIWYFVCRTIQSKLK